jgi:branched-chain amino acid transport system substrate-binding protein
VKRVPVTPRARSRRCLGGVLAVVAVSAASGCTGGGDDTTPSTTLTPTTTTVPEREHDGVLSLGLFLPTTGEGASIGAPMIEAITTAIDEINEQGGVFGSDVELTVVDEGAGSISELLEAGVDAIVGPASSNIALSQLSAAVDPTAGVVTCSPTATAIELDAYPDNGFFFRTAPSDSLQMAAIAFQAERTGVRSVALGYLDDPYGRGLAVGLEDAMRSRSLDLTASIGFGADQDDLSEIAAALVADNPGVVVVLGDADDGSRLLTALDAAVAPTPRAIIVNDSIRQARQTIQGLSTVFRDRLQGVAAQSSAFLSDGPEGFFVAHALDCVNLITLAALDAGSDNPVRIRANMAAVSTGGRVCASFEQCASLVEQNLGIDYAGLSGRVELSSATGDPVRAWFESFGFDADGNEVHGAPVEIGL